MRLIINGDDFGYTLANTQGIIEAHHNVHDRTSQALEVSLKLTKEYDIPLRGHNEFQFIQDFNSHKGTSVASMIQILEDHKGKVLRSCAIRDFVI